MCRYINRNVQRKNYTASEQFPDSYYLLLVSSNLNKIPERTLNIRQSADFYTNIFYNFRAIFKKIETDMLLVFALMPSVICQILI